MPELHPPSHERAATVERSTVSVPSIVPSRAAVKTADVTVSVLSSSTRRTHTVQHATFPIFEQISAQRAPLLVLGVLANGVCGFLQVYRVTFLGTLVEQLALGPGLDPNIAYGVALMQIWFGLGAWASGSIGFWCCNYVDQQSKARFQRKQFAGVLAQPVAWHEQGGTAANAILDLKYLSGAMMQIGRLAEAVTMLLSGLVFCFIFLPWQV